MFKEAVIAYIKGLFGVFPERIYYYFNPEGDFQDIRPYMPIEDYSLVPFIIAGILVLALLFLAIKKGIKAFKKWRSETKKAIAKAHLKALDVNDGKACAYAFTKWAKFLVTEKNQQQFDAIEAQLFNYKYKKSTTILSEKEAVALRSFVEGKNG